VADTLRPMIVGFVGAGNIAGAIARGWAAAEGGPDQMLFTDSGSGRATALAADVGGEAVGSNAELVQRCDALVLAMKPKFLEAVAPETQGAELVVSLLGAGSLERLTEAYPDATVVRVLPNPAVEVHRGVMCLSSSDPTGDAAAQVRRLFEPLGRVVEIDDAIMDPATAVMGCAMAFFAIPPEAIAKASAVDGLDEELSLSLAIDTMAGTAEMLRRYSPPELRKMVASPGGDTEAGLEELERNGGADDFAAAARASLERMRSRH
jgi:pyrroline-5-carboxylate reductase